MNTEPLNFLEHFSCDVCQKHEPKEAQGANELLSHYCMKCPILTKVEVESLF